MHVVTDEYEALSMLKTAQKKWAKWRRKDNTKPVKTVSPTLPKGKREDRRGDQ